MKQLEMTPELEAMIHKAVGPDVETANLAVFETIALNQLPLPGKDGTIFERATTSALTLVQMSDYLNTTGQSLPVIFDHQMEGSPTGRAFAAGLGYEADGVELRILFYVDSAVEPKVVGQLNNGTLDEVSVAFLSSEFNCSECGWDYFSFGADENIWNRTCGNGHTIGLNGVHAEMVGLQTFVELSLVARGAASNPKIVGRSASKLAPESALRLAAKGFDPNALVVQASRGIDTMDTVKLVSDFAELTGKFAVANADKARFEGQVTSLTTELSARDATIVDLNAQLAAAKTTGSDDVAALKAENAEAVSTLQGQFNALRVAKGETALEGDALPAKVADLKTEIAKLTAGLTAILPVDGVTTPTKDDGKDAKLAFNPSAFSLRRK